MISFPMSEEQFAAASAKLKAAGVAVEGPTGTLSRDGVSAKYTYANGALTVEILEKPFFLPESFIEGKLKEFFESSSA